MQLFTARVMIASLVAATFFAGNTGKTHLFLNEHGYVPEMLSKSRLNRHLDFVLDRATLAS